MKEITKRYTNGEVTIVWQPAKCIHSAICVKGLPEVFNAKARPWITPEGATTERIIEQVKACPSGAISYQMNDAENQEAESPVKTIVEALPNGPLLVYGTLLVKDRAGNETLKTKTTAFCRCGASANKPYCDGAHTKVGFQDA